MPAENAEIKLVVSEEPVKKDEVKAPARAAKKPVVRRTKTSSSAKPAKTVKSVNVSSSAKPVDVTDPAYYLNREINWIDFDSKVLEQAKDATVPLLERVKFLSIFYNNLDEFFMVRVANVWKQVQSGADPTGADKLSPRRQFSEIGRRVREICDEAELVWKKQIVPALEKKAIRIVKYADLAEKKRQALDAFYDSDIYPVLTPQVIDSGHPFPLVSNLSINFIMELVDAKNPKDVRHARLKCPDNLPRFLFLPHGKEEIHPDLSFDPGYTEVDVVLIEDLVEERMHRLFPGFNVKAVGQFRVTRNTDVEIEEDEADDLLAAVRDYVDQRRFGDIIRVEMGRGIPVRLADLLIEYLDVKPHQVYKQKIPLAFSAFMGLGCIDRPKLQYKPDRTKLVKELDMENDCFAAIRKQDIVMYHPYDRFQGVLNFIEQAARDPKVVAIKQTLYRCGSDSPVIRSLLEARRRGKQVTAVVELKARFDEERNINWAEELERAGVNVVYGFVGLKIHAKLCLVVRREADGIRRYVHVATGNYNASSAKIYTDLGILTDDEDICADVTDLFNVMTGCGRVDAYRKILVSPNTLRPSLMKLIDDEIRLHQEHGNGHIILKCNQLVDGGIIAELYRASLAGVKIECLVRGICCLRPGVPGLSENITVRSIVGRYLEHARVYWFNHNGDEQMYIGSADMMNRNLNGRIEVLAPISSVKIRKNIIERILQLQLNDTEQAWQMNADGTYTRLRSIRTNKRIDSQSATHHTKHLY